jgi:hypothetical protein
VRKSLAQGTAFFSLGHVLQPVDALVVEVMISLVRGVQLFMLSPMLGIERFMFRPVFACESLVQPPVLPPSHRVLVSGLMLGV